jgi:hypothetical protein
VKSEKFILLRFPKGDIMLSTKSKAFKITDKPGETYRVYWLAAIVASLCIVLSGCSGTSPLTSQTTSAAASNTGTSNAISTAKQVATSGTASNVIAAAGNAAPTITRILNATVTAWTNNRLLPGPFSQTISIINKINTSTGAVTATFAPFKLTDPVTGRTVTASLPAGTTATGHFNASTGALTLNSPLLLQNIPLIGTALTKSVTLATGNTITTPNGAKYSGQALNALNKITMVGGTSLQTGLLNANVLMRIAGVLQPASQS